MSTNGVATSVTAQGTEQPDFKLYAVRLAPAADALKATPNLARTYRRDPPLKRIVVQTAPPPRAT